VIILYLETGTILNNFYRVVRLLGKGSMGNVYLVERLKDDKKFVVKELMFSGEAGLDMSTAREIFFREAEFIVKFNHPGLPAMYGIFTENNRDYLTMDYIEGKNLEEIINSSPEPISEESAINWVIKIAHILDYLHNSFHAPIVYRDLKPSNIIITPGGNPKLVDFGICRYYNPEKNTDTFSYGSPGYAAPEQYRGRGQSTPRTDVFGLGVILFQMLTKYDPTLKPLTFPPMKSLNPLISGELESIISRAIQLDPANRYISIMEFKEKLERYSGFYSYPPEEGSPKLTNKWAWTGLILALLAVVSPFLTSFLCYFLSSVSSSFISDILFFTYTIIVLVSPPLGLIAGIIGSIKARKDKNISSVPVSLAIGCNSLIILFMVLMIFILSSGFLKARAQGTLAACESNLKNIAMALEMYAADNEGHYPASIEYLTKTSYIKAIPPCPGSIKTPYGYIYAVKPDNFTLWCSGVKVHNSVGVEDGFPQYNPGNGLRTK